MANSRNDRGAPAPGPARRVALVVALVVAAAAGCKSSAIEGGGSAGTSGKDGPMVEIKTNFGVITAELYPDKAPKTVANFLEYVDAGFYDGTIFHRVIPTFMIQGGGFDAQMNKKPTRAPVVNEAGNGLSNATGTLAMARTSDPNSATAQFFINVKDNDRLDRSGPSPAQAGYAVFGKVKTGMDVVLKIKDVPTGMAAGMNDVPTTPVVIESIRRVK
jgi:cyclophilin family peptidyl-prolyl cis-trans isomerase